jgi:hypothetical protein
MRHLHLVSVLMAAALADGSTGGEGQSPYEPNPNTNDLAGAAPAPENIGAPAPDPSVNGGPSTADLVELDEDFQRRLAAERAELDRLRRETPIQEIEIHPCQGTGKLGLIFGTPDGIRCVELADWRTDRVCLQAGDHAQLVVLVGEGLKTWEFYREQEARSKARAAEAAAQPAVDPETLRDPDAVMNQS